MTGPRVLLAAVVAFGAYELLREYIARSIRRDIPPILRAEVARQDNTGVLGGLLVTPGITEAIGATGEQYALMKLPTLFGRKARSLL